MAITRFASRYLRFLLGLILVLLMCSCETERKPIEIGFVGGLTGRVAGLGIAGRDGALLAVEEVNAAGGINGRGVNLVVKDDKQNPEVALKAVQELVQQDVVAIIGHMTSSMSSVTLPIINKAKKVMISPTSKSDIFSGKDDYFLRVTSASSFNATKIAKLSYQEMGRRKFAIVYDVNNKAFTESWMQQFSSPYQALGGKVVVAKEFLSGSPDLSFLTLVKEVLASEPDALLILASALDTALIMQQLKKVEAEIPVFASEWSFTSDLLNYGGKAVEGLTSYHSFNTSSTRQLYLDYKKRFIRRFGYEPSFASVLSYDATKLLLEGVKRNSNPAQIKQSLLGIGTFSGLQSDIKLDQYGDVTRELFRTVIADGHFQIID